MKLTRPRSRGALVWTVRAIGDVHVDDNDDDVDDDDNDDDDDDDHNV